MTSAAAFKAEFCDIKLIRTRKCMQVIFEVPVEQSNDVLKALGGMPNPGTSVWCAIARLNEKEVMPSDDNQSKRHADTSPRPAPAQSDGAKRRWDEMSAAQQAGVLCNEAAFHKFLNTKFKNLKFETPEAVATAVRDMCGVTSRSQIDGDKRALTRWNTLVEEYRFWMREPEYA